MGSIIEIKCNKCGFVNWIYYGGGFLRHENNYYYCPKCFRIKNFPTNELELKAIEITEKHLPIKKCGYCKIERKPFKFKFSETPPKIKAPADFCCQECHSNNLEYSNVGCWD